MAMESSSSSSLCSLQKDLCLEILTRLDSKTLTRFKLVSKHWNLFVSDPLFSLLYSRRRRKLTGFFYRSSDYYREKLRYVPIDHEEEDISDPSSSLGFLDSPAVLVNSCNGLLHWFSTSDHQFISNPLTRKSVLLPWPINVPDVFACGIAFDPSQSSEFKILALSTESGLGTLQSMVFSSELMQWSEANETLDICHLAKPYKRLAGIFLGGSLYWEQVNSVILAIDVSSQSCRMIDSPASNPEIRPYTTEPASLGLFSGKLHYCRVVGSKLIVWCETWVSLSSSGRVSPIAWVVKHKIELYPMGSENRNISRSACEALAILPNCAGVLFGVAGRIMVIRFEDNDFVEVCEVQRNGNHCVKPSVFFPFVHSLALFNLEPEKT